MRATVENGLIGMTKKKGWVNCPACKGSGWEATTSENRIDEDDLVTNCSDCDGVSRVHTFTIPDERMMEILIRTYLKPLREAPDYSVSDADVRSAERHARRIFDELNLGGG
jgi:hypothetical protein